MTRSAHGSRTPTASTIWPDTRFVDDRRAHTGAIGSGWRRSRRAALVDDLVESATAHRSTRTFTSSTTSTRYGRCVWRAAAVPLWSHPRVAGYRVTNDMRSVGGIPDPPIHIPPDGRLAIPRQLRRGRTASRRRSAGGVRHSRHGLQNAVARARGVQTSAAAQAKIVAAGLPDVLAQRLALGR